jgi:hypothetical protein|tara:strand:- start:9150 stop:9368 length:219 start_codon:yes stop_codon:yes gene_type:complete
MGWIKNLILCKLLGNEYEYGTCLDRDARRSRLNGNVQYVLWYKGDQKYLDGIGHLKDKWVDFSESHWVMFEK